MPFKNDTLDEYDNTLVSQHFFEIKIDGVLNAKVENENPQQYRDVTVGTAVASKLPPANALIRNLVYQQCQESGTRYYKQSNVQSLQILWFKGCLFNDEKRGQSLAPSIQEKLEDPADLPLIDLFLNTRSKGDLELMQKIMIDLIKANFPFDQISKNFPSLFNLLWHSNLPCTNKDDNPGSEYLLKKCLLHGEEVDCASIFTPVPTDLGICCSFNHRNVLRDSEFSRILKMKQNIKVEDAEDEIYLAEIGEAMGLQVYVDQHSNRVTPGSVFSTSRQVFVMFITF